MKAVDAGEGGNRYGKKVPWDLGSQAYIYTGYRGISEF